MMLSPTDRVATIKKTRAITAGIIRQSLDKLDGRSETDVCQDILTRISSSKVLHRAGWYDPPPGGASVLFAAKPFDHLKYETIRDPIFWPSESYRFMPETVGLVYASSVDKQSGLFGDHGLTIYRGTDSKIKKHVREVHEVICASAEAAEVGMKFSELYAETMRIFSSHSKAIKWMTTINDIRKTNLGHTVPGSLETEALPNGTFEEIRQIITKGRIFINEVADFTIPTNCAFTVEARLADVNDTEMPNVFFHFTVTFSEGKKDICSDFDDIFRAIGMDYML